MKRKEKTLTVGPPAIYVAKEQHREQSSRWHSLRRHPREAFQNNFVKKLVKCWSAKLITHLHAVPIFEELLVVCLLEWLEAHNCFLGIPEHDNVFDVV